MLRALVVLMLVGVAFVALCGPADAAVTASSLSLVGPNPVSGTCPVNVQFTGTITASPGTVFTYSFSRFVNGTQQIVTPPGQPTTMPPTGTIPVSDSIPVSAPTGANTFDQLWVHSISGAQPDLYSNKANFTVPCTPIVISTPTPKNFLQNIHNSQNYALIVPLPTNLANTQSAKVCSAHGGLAGLFCPDSLHNGYLVLVWDWEGNPLNPKVDGFRIYEVDGGQHKLVDTVPHPQLTISFQRPIQGGFGGKCYAATAYIGTRESANSQTFCVPAGYTGQQFKTLHTNNWAFHFYNYLGSGALGDIGFGLKCDDMCLGWDHLLSGGGLTLTHDNAYWRSYLQFDPNQINGFYIYKAFLKMRRTSGDPKCFGSIGAADGQAWNTNAMPSADWETPSGVINNTGAELDVTLIVRSWAQGTPNFGFAFKGTNEDTGANDNGSCMIDFSPNDALLSIEYY
jgi:hypothetical protein